MASTGNQPVTSNNEEDFALQLTGASLFPMVFQAALELDVLEIIARAGPDAHLSSSEIASQLPTQHPNTPFMLDRILKLLASYSVVTCSLITLDNGQVQRTYGLAPVCKYFVRNQDGVSLVPLLLLSQDKVFIDTWHHLKDAVLEGGIPFNKVYGVNAFDYFSKDPRCNQVFNKAMFDYTSISMKKLLETYKGFKELKELVDVGGGFGVTLHMITSEYPTIKGINFDLPHVIENAPSYPGVEHVGGDMFVSVPKADVIFLKWILHNWSDDQCLKLLKNCYEAIPDFGKVIVVDAVLPEVPETNDAAKGVYQLDLIMMARYPGGKERTEKEFEALAKGAGFISIKLVCCFFNYWVMEFYKV